MKYLGSGLIIVVLVAFMALGCDDRKDVATYTVPKMPAATRPADSGGISSLMPPAVPAHPATAAAATWDAPTGWEVDPPKAMREAGYHIGDGAQRADLIITRLSSGGFGMWAANVNRWRAQAGLEPIDEQAVQQLQPKTATVSGREARTYDFTGPAGPSQQRVVVTMISDGDVVWFIKTQGSAQTIAKNQAAHEALVTSFKFAP